MDIHSSNLKGNDFSVLPFTIDIAWTLQNVLSFVAMPTAVVVEKNADYLT